MPITTAWHITFSTYGTWLPGDERGTVNRTGGGILPPDLVRKEFHEERLKHPKVTLNAKARRIVRETIEDYCRFKSWRMHALNVRTNHVHVVIGAQENGSKILNGLKARATRVLRISGAFPPDRPVWSERGHKQALDSARAVEEAIHYVLHKQGPDLPEE